MATASSMHARGRHNAWDMIAASQTDSILVAAVTGRKIAVVAFVINQGAAAASTVTFNTKPAGAGSAIYPTLQYAVNGGTTAAETNPAYFTTNVGEGLSVTTGAGSTTGISVVFELLG